MNANSVKTLLVGLLLFSTHSTFVFGQDDDIVVEDVPNVYEDDGDDGEDDADAWDNDEEFDLDDNGGDDDVAQDPWDNTDPTDVMEDALPDSLHAAIHLSSADIPPGILEFIQYELPHYPQLVVRDVGVSPASLRIFASEDHLKAYTLSEALENGAVPEEQLAELQEIPLPPREVLLSLAMESIDVSDMSAQELRGALADFNVLRKERVGGDDDDDLDIDDDDDEVVFGEDGEVTGEGKPRKRKKRVDWRARREDRLKKMHQEKRESKESGFNPSYKISDGIGLGLPWPVLLLVVVGGVGASGYLGFLLYNTLQENEKKEELKKLKSQKKSQKKFLKEKGKKKRL